MPIYEYRCKSCGDFEVMQRITDRALTRCPTCQRKVTKLISNTSFQLKGTGWYITDYGRGGGKSTESAKSSETPKESTSEAKAESKSDSQPASAGKSEGKRNKSKEAAAA